MEIGKLRSIAAGKTSAATALKQNKTEEPIVIDDERPNEQESTECNQPVKESQPKQEAP